MRILPLSALLVVLAACSSSPLAEGGTPATDGGTTNETTDGGGDQQPSPAAEFIPTPTGDCPEFEQGTVTFTANGKTRDARIWISEAAQDFDGPLVFWWHGAGGNPGEGAGVLGSGLKQIVDAGGVVVAFYHDPAAGQLPWYLSLGGSKENDLLFADEAVGCAIEKVGIDVRRIHSVGFSAGAMHNTQFAALRSGYLASIVNYSPAQLSEPEEQNADNKYAVMLFHGGQSDQVAIINFDTYTEDYHKVLKANGHFSLLCNHNTGHTVPNNARAAAWQFLKDHPYGVNPEPYADALPDTFPSYCTLD